ncbi:hypothetical protein JTB14_030427 [Gonioctena quinquepunctata]|nr:hypothetical protein JTB14_030427 [Gonioctena quinquepunctata]
MRSERVKDVVDLELIEKKKDFDQFSSLKPHHDPHVSFAKIHETVEKQISGTNNSDESLDDQYEDGSTFSLELDKEKMMTPINFVLPSSLISKESPVKKKP